MNKNAIGIIFEINKVYTIFHALFCKTSQVKLIRVERALCKNSKMSLKEEEQRKHVASKFNAKLIISTYWHTKSNGSNCY